MMRLGKTTLAVLLSLMAVAWVSCGKSDIEPDDEPDNKKEQQDTTSSNTGKPSDKPSDNPSDNPSATVDGIPVVRITTDNGSNIDSKEHYWGCQIVVEGHGVCPDYKTKEGKSDSIRGRGNSTWLFYPKKPYRIKLYEKNEFMGMGKGKKFVMLANYRDPTNLMNAFVFDLARNINMPFTNSNHFAEVYLNGDYIGLYDITEQICQGKNSVNIDSEKGVLLSLDHDDGPIDSPDAKDNFFSKVFSSSYDAEGLPVCVKYPEDPTAQRLTEIRNEFGDLEQCIYDVDYDKLKQMMDVNTFFGFLAIQELTKNVELVTPRSMYMYHDADKVWKFGPVWDFDGGFSYDWADYAGEGRGYFGSQSFMMGHQAARDIPQFFTKMFTSSKFLSDYKAYWTNTMCPAIDAALAQLEDRLAETSDAQQRNTKRWNIREDYNAETQKMITWLTNRKTKYTAYLKNWKAENTVLYDNYQWW